MSGGEEGALNGPSLMPGGTREAYDQIAEVLTTIAAQVDGEPCCTYIGDGGAGHFVKMVHNGIEYADMQLIAEAYDLLRTGAGLTNDELADTFTEWNEGELESFLIEITARIFRRHVEAADDDPSGEGELHEPEGWLIDVIRGAAGQKGTGRLTVTAALDVGAPATTTAEAVFARVLSSLADERAVAAEVLPGPDAGDPVTPDDRDAFVNDVRTALYASKIVAYAQGFDILRRASDEHHWDLDLGALATIWRGGCIIRAQFLNRIRESYADDPDLVNLMLAPTFTDALADAQDGWRRIVAHGAPRRDPAARRSRPRSRSTTATAASGSPPTSSRPNATCSARTPTRAPTGRARSTRSGSPPVGYGSCCTTSGMTSPAPASRRSAAATVIVHPLR